MVNPNTAPVSPSTPSVEDQLRVALETTQQLQAKLDAARFVLGTLFNQVLARLAPAGTVVASGQPPFGLVSVLQGNSRGARAFELASDLRLESIHPVHLSLSRATARAYPLNPDGSRMTGPEEALVTLSLALPRARSHEAPQSPTELVLAWARATPATRPTVLVPPKDARLPAPEATEAPVGCLDCEGTGEQGGQFCGGYWVCCTCGGTGVNPESLKA